MKPILWENDVLTIRELLEDTAKRYGDKPCIRYMWQGEVVTKSYRDMCEDSFSVCRYIRSRIPERAHIAIIGKTNYEYITCLNGVFTAGDVAVPMAYDMTAEQTAQILNDCEAKAVFYDDSFGDRLEQVKALCPQVEHYEYIGQKDKFDEIYSQYHKDGAYAALSDVRIDPDACSAIIYTSGTTGEKKGAMLSSRAIISNVYYKEMNFEGEHVTLNVLPMHHIFCFSCDYLKNLKDGVTICLNGDLSNINQNLLRFEPTVIRLVPMIIESLDRKVRIAKRRNPSLSMREAAESVFGRRLRNIIASGAALSPQVAHEFDEMGITIRQGYGMTETGPRISVPDGNTCPESGGRIISTCQVRLQNGEIQVQSPSLMMGYYKKPKETAEVFTDDGWFKTGDTGRITDDRELFIIGRLKNIIVLANGENVSPEEIEKKYIGEPLVKEILVFEKDGKIAAKIFPNYDYAEKEGIKDIDGALQELIAQKNAQDVAAKEIDDVLVSPTPLEKTGTGKIIRK